MENAFLYKSIVMVNQIVMMDMMNYLSAHYVKVKIGFNAFQMDNVLPHISVVMALQIVKMAMMKL